VHMLYLYILLPPHPRSTLFPYTTRFRSGLQMVLRQEEDIDVVGEAGDGHEAVDKAQELMPDVVLMDVRMPGQSGIKATEQIKDLLPHAKILMLTISDEEADLYDAIKAGAS